MKKNLAIIVALLVALLATPVLAEEDADIFYAEFSTEDILTGEIIDQTYFEDSYITLINFWATWCGPCIDEMPDLAQVYEASGETIKVLGVLTDAVDEDGNLDEDAINNAIAIAQETGVEYPIIAPAGSLEDIAAALEVWPTTLVVDNEGIAYDRIAGTRSLEKWIAIAEDWIKEIYVTEE